MINKSEILNIVSEEDLIRHLVPEFTGKLRKRNYKSILSTKDDHPSLSFYKDEGSNSWKFKSHNTGHQGDILELWAAYHGLDCKTEFPKLLEKINEEMNLGLEKKKEPFTIDYMTFSNVFLSYWEQFGIDRDTLVKYDVRQVAYFSFESDGKPLTFYYRQQGKIVIAYHIDNRIKLYIPAIPERFLELDNLKAQSKFFGYKNQSKNDVFGLKQLSEGELEYIIFTAGEKDCLAASARGFNAISLQSENQLPPDNLLEKLSKKTRKLLFCYDNDRAGTTATEKLEKEYGLTPIRLPQKFKDIAEYFLENSTEDFKKLLDDAIRKNKSVKKDTADTTEKKLDSKEEKLEGKKKETILHKVEDYLTSKYDFRFDTIALSIEQRTKERTENWSIVNDSQLWRELNKEDIKVPIQNVQNLLKSDFVAEYDPIQSYFLRFELEYYQEDFIAQLSDFVILEDEEEKEDWKNHLKKWMIRAIRTVFEPYAINKHAIILVSPEEGIGKSFFCEFLCPKSLRNYYTSNPIISQEKDSQVALATNFIINLDELQQFRSNSSRLKSWISQTHIKIRLPYERKETTKNRVCSFIGSSNEDDFLRSELGYSRWLCFKVKETRTIDSTAEALLEKAWGLAYNLYKKNQRAGELSKEETLALKDKNKAFKFQSPEQEILANYISPSLEGEGEFMTTTDILQYLQPRVTIKLNKIILGRALREHNFERSITNRIYGYWIRKR